MAIAYKDGFLRRAVRRQNRFFVDRRRRTAPLLADHEAQAAVEGR